MYWNFLLTIVYIKLNDEQNAAEYFYNQPIYTRLYNKQNLNTTITMFVNNARFVRCR